MKNLKYLFIATIIVFFSCNKDEGDDVNPSDGSSEVTDPDTNTDTNTVVFNDRTFTLATTDQSFDNSHGSTQLFETDGVDLELTVVLPNTNPFSGGLNIVEFTGENDDPGSGNIAIELRTFAPDYFILESSENSSGSVEITNANDTVVVNIKNVTLINALGESKKINAIVKIATEELGSEYQGSATFTNGSGTEPSYSTSSGTYTYRWGNSGFNFQSLNLYFSEPASAGTYTIVSQNTVSGTDEVAISIVTSTMANYSSEKDGSVLTVTEDTDGTLNFSFSDAAAFYYDGNFDRKSIKISGTASILEVEVDQP